MVAQALDISRETYLAILMDRAHSGPVMVGSPYGGMDIEEVAAKDPNAIFTVRTMYTYPFRHTGHLKEQFTFISNFGTTTNMLTLIINDVKIGT